MAAAWFILIVLFLAAYILLDGYDLGAGVISLFERKREVRHATAEQVATGWDGNEVWLVLLAVGFWSGFPQAFGVILQQLYIPIIVVLFALVLRAFSIELISQRGRTVNGAWYVVFGVASLVAAFAQGLALGALTSPIALDADGGYIGSPSDAFSWFSVLTGVTVTLGYVALGYAFLERRGVGDLDVVARQGRRVTVVVVIAAAICLIAINATAAPLDLSTSVRAFAFWGLLVFAAIGAGIALATFGRTNYDNAPRRYPFIGLAVTVVAVLGALVVSHFPLLVPPDITVYSAAGPTSTLWFLFVAVGLTMPFLLVISGVAHRVFRHPASVETDRPREPDVEGADRVL